MKGRRRRLSLFCKRSERKRLFHPLIQDVIIAHLSINVKQTKGGRLVTDTTLAIRGRCDKSAAGTLVTTALDARAKMERDLLARRQWLADRRADVLGNTLVSSRRHRMHRSDHG
jgi:hypothetical protein